MKFYLDDILITDEPNGDIITTIKRDSQLGGFLITNDAKLKWHGDGFDYIQSVINTEGFCGEIKCDIWDECNGQQVRIFTGKVFILEIEKNSNCIITAPVQDNNFYARINKNKSIEITVDTTRSKNAVTIEAAAENSITMFKPSTGATTADPRIGYRVYDVFKNMVAFMSDGEVEFDSNYFGLGGEFEGLSVMYGQEITFFGTGGAIKASFDKAFNEVKKKTNCTLYIDTTGVIPKLRIEKYGDLFINSIIHKLENINSVRFKIDSSKLIATISVGSTKLIDVLAGTGGVSFVESNIYQTYKKEDYTLLEQCNIDSRMDLVSEYVISSNVIEDALIFSTTTHSEDIIFVDCEDVTASGTNYTSTAILGNPFNSSPPYFYNTRLMNNEVLDRWASLIPNSISSFQGTVNELFRASLTTNDPYSSNITVDPYQFSDDYNFPNFDGNGIVNNYGNGTAQGTPVSAANSRYTCPNDGEYIFYVTLRLTYASNLTTGSAIVLVELHRKNAGGTLLQSIGAYQNFSGLGVQFVSLSNQTPFNCDATDYVEVAVTVSVSNAGIIIAGSGGASYFSCISAPNSGGIFNLLDNQRNIPIVKADFEYPIENSTFYDIEASPFEKIAITYQDKVKSGWIDTFKYNHLTSEANITLLGTQEMLN